MLRSLSRELAVHEIGREHRGLIGAGGEDPLGLPYPEHAGELHEAFGLIAADVPSLTLQQGVHLPPPVHAVMFRVEPPDLRDKQLVT